MNCRHFRNACSLARSFNHFSMCTFFSSFIWCWLFAIKMLFLKTLKISTFQTKIMRIYHSTKSRGANVLFDLKSKQLSVRFFFVLIFRRQTNHNHKTQKWEMYGVFFFFLLFNKMPIIYFNGFETFSTHVELFISFDFVFFFTNSVAKV